MDSVLRLVWVILLLAFALRVAPANADDETPWSTGVSDENKAKAQALLDEGNQLFVDNRFSDALEKYKAAVALWDHPAIRFNIVRALINLDRPVEAAENLDLSLKYGKAPLTDAIFQEAHAYQKLLAGQIANISVACTQSGTKVSLDGQTFIEACPGEKKTRLRPGKHMIVGELAGHMTMTKEVIALPAADEKIDVQLVDLSNATVSKRRWAAWKPWAIAGGGAALAAIGGLIQWRASADMDQYNATVAVECPMGCHPGEASNSTLALERRATLENRIAIGTMITGGIAAAAGIALVIINRPREVLDEGLYRREQERAHVTAQVSDHELGLGLAGSF